jgi:hypothetical protein
MSELWLLCVPSGWNAGPAPLKKMKDEGRTGKNANRGAGQTYSRTSGTEWRKMALFWEVFSSVSRGPEAIQNGALLGMGGAEVASAQTTRLPSLVSVESA